MVGGQSVQRISDLVILITLMVAVPPSYSYVNSSTSELIINAMRPPMNNYLRLAEPKK